ncbi:MAG: beta-galactosidase [Bryobacterales bacterium]|nr:beta-galactosidase [Bryobacterales bacterium]
MFPLPLLLLPVVASGSELVLPQAALERSGPTPIVYRLNSLATGKGELHLRWTDSYGRTIEDRTAAVNLHDENEIGFTIDTRRAVAMRNEITARFRFEGVNRRGEKDTRDETVKAVFTAIPPVRDWWDYEIIMWQRHSAEQAAVLRRAGISGGQHVARTKSLPEFLLNNNLRWYAENMATDFYAEYHRYFPDRTNSWKFNEVREQYKKDRTSKEPLKRRPSLSDAAWLQRIRERLIENTKYYSPYKPFFYSLGDESGIANLAAFWDFDFSDESIVPMRGWLRERYGSLEKLNAQWETNFSAWDSAMPPTTDEAMKRGGENFSAWSDFKEWMDVSFAAALRMGREAIQSVDPQAYVGIGGGQMPGWGGYDYARIVKALNAIEPYDIGNNIEIIRSLNPNMAVVTASFASGPWEKHRVWYELLHGNRGLIIWDDKQGFIGPGVELNARAAEAGPYYRELRGGVASLLVNSRRVADPIAIHYSQASMRIEWMLAQRPKGESWVTRNSSTEYRDSEFLRLRESFCRIVEDTGRQYNFVSYDQVEQGELMRGGYRVLLLPKSTALSAAEAEAMRRFVAQGGTLIAEGMPGTFDEHCRRLPKGQLEDVFRAGKYGEGRAVLLSSSLLNYHMDRVVEKEGGALKAMNAMLSSIAPRFAVSGAFGLETHTFENGGVQIAALHSNPELRIDELGPPEFKSNERFAKEKPAVVRLSAPSFVYDIRGAKALGRLTQIETVVDGYEPRIFAVSATAIPEMTVSAPGRVRRGATAEFGIRLASASPAGKHVFHVAVFDPAGPVEHYSGNLRAEGGSARKALPLALNERAGRWEMRVHDVLSGQKKSVFFEVE